MSRCSVFIAVALLAFSEFWAFPATAEMIVDTAWVRRYDGPGNARDWPREMALDSSGNAYVTGESYGDTTFDDYATVKYHPNGNVAWAKRYNGPGNAGDRAYAIAVDSHGNVYVTGESWSGGTGFDYATVKYHPGGDTAWVRRYNGPGNENDAARAAAVDDSGYLYVTGWSYGDGTNSDFATIKYSTDGDTAWVRRYNGPENGYDYPHAIAVDASGNTYVTGYSTAGSMYDYDYVTIKYSSNGDTAWVRRYDGSGNGSDYAYAIALDVAGNVYVTGESMGSGIEPDYLTIKYDPQGEIDWAARYDGPAQWWDAAYAVAVDGSFGVYVTGGSFRSLVDADYTTLKYRHNGDTAWVRRYGGSPDGGDCARDLALDREGNIYVTGYSSSATDFDYATIKYDSDGNVAWLARYNGPESGDDGASALCVDRFGNVYVTGHSYGSGGAEDYVTAKYVQGLRGDANADAVIDLGDVVHLINYLYKSGPAPEPVQVGDCNCDGIVNVGDLVHLINYLYRSGPEPAC